MTMSQKTRDSLMGIYMDERTDERCIITKRLYAAAKELTHEIEQDITDAQTLIDNDVKARDMMIETKKSILRDQKLFGLMFEVDNKYRTCKIDETHPELLRFDSTTNVGKREILTQK